LVLFTKDYTRLHGQQNIKLHNWSNISSTRV